MLCLSTLSQKITRCEIFAITSFTVNEVIAKIGNQIIFDTQCILAI